MAHYYLGHPFTGVATCTFSKKSKK